MAAGKMCVRGSKEETSTWVELFPNELKTVQQSLVFTKRMVVVAVSSITYLRGIFPEYSYRSRYLEDLCVKVLRENCDTPGANKVVKWMVGCFEALEKQYLQMIYLGVYTNPEDPDCIVESYQFNFRYGDTGPEMEMVGKNKKEMIITVEETKNASVLLIRKLFLLMQNLDSLPNNVYMTMKLYYYDEITPLDYQPPGFKEGVFDHLWFEGTPMHFKMGEVSTTFHTMRVKVSVEQKKAERFQKGGSEKKKLPAVTEQDEKKPVSPKKFCADPSSDDESAQFKIPAKPAFKKKLQARTLTRKRRKI